MHRQTVDSITPMLSLLQQPAFCIRSNGTMVCNALAKDLSPACAAALPQWLGPCKPIYDMWDKTSNLQFSLSVCATQFSVTLQALQDGILFLMTPCTAVHAAADALGVVSQTLRRPLSDLSSLLYLMSGNPTESQNAAVQRQLCQMTRIVSNLSELTRLSQEEPTLLPVCTNTDQFLSAFLDEVEALCQHTGRTLSRMLPKKAIEFQADEALLKRALLNLLSNALKFGTPNTSVIFRVETIGTHLVFQVENECPNGGGELLRSAFSRLSQRELLPDPKWGVGLGLPLANAIARLHGGMVAVETNNHRATVSLSISLHQFAGSPKLASFAADYTGGFCQTLLELSDALPNEAYEN